MMGSHLYMQNNQLTLRKNSFSKAKMPYIETVSEKLSLRWAVVCVPEQTS